MSKETDTAQESEDTALTDFPSADVKLNAVVRTSRIYFGATMVNGVARKMIDAVGLPDPELLSLAYEEYDTDEADEANTFVFKSTDADEKWTATFYVSDQ